MDPLITIETVPIKIEYTRKQSAHTTATQSAKLNVSRDADSLMIHSDPISIPMTDTFEFNPSGNWNNLTYTATAQYSANGNLRMNVQMSGSEADSTYQYQQFDRSIDNMVDYFPDSAGTSSNSLDSMKIDFDMSGVFGASSSDSDAVDTSFYPPDLEFKVVEQPKVIVKYVGGPIYVPPSADPKYDPSKAVKMTYFPASADPKYDPSKAVPAYFPENANPIQEGSETAEAAYFPESADPNYDEEMTQMYDSKSRLDLRA